MVRSCAADATVQIMNPDVLPAAQFSASFACFAVAWDLMHKAKKTARESFLPPEFTAPEFNHQAWLLRDIFGNPFRPVACDPAWRTSTAVGLAEVIYDDRAFDRLPILADALQDAGCEDADILAHCRGDGPHVRGCWVVDLVLGKE
ncbi:hypothetical protein [Limnoglobus roseus]|nr:hypothetical protein [Limnoglobus roseus]